MTGPCEWDVNYGACDPPAEWDALTPEQRATFEQMATEFLWRWTGRVLGLCEVEISPCRMPFTDRMSTFEGKGPYPSGGMWRPVIINGKWYNIGCGSCGDECYCDGPAAIELPGVVDSIVEITVHGEVLPEDAYHVEAHHMLVRDDGGVWPTDPDDWTITYMRGVPVPIGGQIAAGVLALELFRAACGSDQCGLPKRFQSMTRQGVTVAMLDSFDDIDKGHTGIWIIDSWVASMTQIPRRSAVYSPDIRPVVRRVT